MKLFKVLFESFLRCLWFRKQCSILLYMKRIPLFNKYICVIVIFTKCNFGFLFALFENKKIEKEKRNCGFRWME